MKFLQLTYLSLLALCITGCDPIEIDRVDDEPEFSVTFNLDGEEFIFSAGDDNKILATEIFNLINITNYSGTFEDKDGASSPQIAFKFRVGEEVYNSNEADHLNSFNTGSIGYVSFDDALLPYPEIMFTSEYEGPGTPNAYVWEFGDGASVDFRNPIHLYPNATNYDVTVAISDDNQCTARATNTVSFDNREDCVARIDITNIDGSNAVLEAISDGVEPFQYQWDNGTSANDNAIVIADSEALQEVCVTITDANNCVSVNCIGLKRNASGTVNTCIAEMTENNYSTPRRAVQFNAVEVSYNDKMGLELTSTDGLQSSDAFFNIISFEEYERNDAGERTVKIEFDFSCTVWETLGTNPRPLSGKGSVAVAIPD